MNNKYKDITIALAGICQAIDCVQSIARNGQANKNDMDALFKAALRIDANDAESVFGSTQELQTGFRTVIAQLSGSKTDVDFGRYLVNVISLESQFINNDSMMTNVAARIGQANRLLDYNDNDEISTATIQQLADLYKETISTLSTKIQVTGNSKYLEQVHHQAAIRALLLGAIRSAVLWRQVGGKKRHFIFNKNSILDTAKSLIS